jgi:hypothetical protein
LTSWTHILLEMLNGIWAISALSLLIICIFYLQHEARARAYRWDLGWRKVLTSGMRVAIAVGVISLGSVIRAASIFLWYLGGGRTDLKLGWVLVGTLIAVTGFVCSVREFSFPIYGQKPWQLTVAAIMVFACSDLAAHLL